MKVSEHWLRSFVDPKASMTELADQLTHMGIEVEHLALGTIDKPQAVMTLKIPPNRGDCLSMEGIARELSMANDLRYQPSKTVAPPATISNTCAVRIEAPELCPRYLGCVIKGINNAGAAPLWLTERLELAGVRSISIVIDILNYVMFELGQPLHAFDLHALDSEIVVRKSKQGEKIQLLNEQEIELDEKTLVIADKTRAHAIAGVMGGLQSSVTDKTVDVFIESAYFDPVAIRLSAQRYGIKTDASYRFERGVDPNLPRRALERTIQLIVEIAGGQAGSIVEEKNTIHLPAEPVIFLRKERIVKMLGITLTDTEILNFLAHLQMRVDSKPEGFTVWPPSFRQDILLEVDLIEEIARLYGFHQLPTEKLRGEREFFPIPETTIPSIRFKEMLVGRGFSEAITYSFIDPKLTEIFEFSSAPLILSNPISTDMAAMRISLWPGLLQAVQYNQRRQLMRARFFEMGTCFLSDPSQIIEKEMLAGICGGTVYQEQWGAPQRLHDYYDIKQDVEALLALTGSDYHFQKGEHPALHPGQTAHIVQSNQIIGYLGALHPRLVKAFELEGPIFVFEIDMAGLRKGTLPKFIALSKYPAIRRDIAVIVDKEIVADALKLAIVSCAGPFLQNVAFFDVYQGKGIEKTQKSMAISLILQHPSRTLVEEEVNAIIKEVLSTLTRQFQATLRE